MVQQAIDQEAKGRTAIIVAHCLSTIRSADVVFVLQSGMVIEKGSHDDLIQADGEYPKVVLLQSMASQNETARTS